MEVLSPALSSMDSCYFICGRLKDAEGARAAAVVTEVQLKEWKQLLEEGINAEIYRPRTASIQCGAALRNARPLIPTIVEKRSLPIKSEKPAPKATNKLVSLFSNAKPPVVKQEPRVVKEEPPAVKEKPKATPAIAESSKPVVKPAKRSEDKKPTKKKRSKPQDSQTRKRIRVIDSDSDSDDPFVADSPQREIISDDEIPETPRPQPTPMVPIVINSKKRRVDKTYMDEDGFMRTVKNVIESCSEDENEENIKPEIKPEVKIETKPIEPKREPEKPKSKAKASKKPSPPSSKQQTNIMSFFGKK